MTDTSPKTDNRSTAEAASNQYRTGRTSSTGERIANRIANRIAESLGNTLEFMGAGGKMRTRKKCTDKVLKCHATRFYQAFSTKSVRIFTHFVSECVGCFTVRCQIVWQNDFGAWGSGDGCGLFFDFFQPFLCCHIVGIEANRLLKTFGCI